MSVTVRLKVAVSLVRNKSPSKQISCVSWYADTVPQIGVHREQNDRLQCKSR